MNLVETFQNLVAQVPELVQPLIVALAGAVPFIEGEGAAAIGILGGINPVIAAISGIVGNFVCVAVLVFLSSGARTAIVNRRNAKLQARESVLVTEGGAAGADAAASAIPESPRKTKFLRALDKYGVPGVSLLGPLLLPTQFTATMLASVGVARARILFWQGLAIVGWTTVLSILMFSLVNAVA